jgi:hypothetical protein
MKARHSAQCDRSRKRIARRSVRLINCLADLEVRIEQLREDQSPAQSLSVGYWFHEIGNVVAIGINAGAVANGTLFN